MVDFGTSDSTVQISCCNFNYIKRALNGIVRLKNADSKFEKSV